MSPALDPAQWAGAKGLTPEWESVREAHAARVVDAFASAAESTLAAAPRPLRVLVLESAARVLSAPPGVRRSLAREPSFQALASRVPRTPRAWAAACSGAAAAAAVLAGADDEVPVLAGPGGLVHLPGTGARALLRGPRGQLRVRRGAIVSGGRVGRAPVVRARMTAESSDPTLARAYDHGRPAPVRPAFVSVARKALETLGRAAPETAEELQDLIRVLVPLRGGRPGLSRSGSLVNAVGALYLTHHDDVPLQYETLVHEFCHQKLYLLDAHSPLLEPGPDEPLWYSPWRDDARPLRGLLLGVHAFANVARHLSLIEDGRAAGARRRVRQCEAALDVLEASGRATPFGTAVLARLRAILRDASGRLSGPEDPGERLSVEEHRRRYAGAGGRHNGAPGRGGIGE